MKRFLNSTAALSVALMNVQPWPVLAQTLTEEGTVIAVDGTVLCTPGGDLACDVLNPELIAQAEKIAADLAAAEAAAQAEAEAAAAAEDKPKWMPRRRLRRLKRRRKRMQRKRRRKQTQMPPPR